MTKYLGNVFTTKMQKKTRNIYDSLSPITWLLKLFAINCNIEYGSSNSKAFYLTKTLITTALVGSLNIYCLYNKIIYIYQFISLSIKLSDAVQMIYDHFQYIVDMWFIYKYGRHVSLEYFKQYEAIDTILGMKDYTIVKRKLSRLTAFFTVIWLTSSASDMTAWVLGYGWITPLAFSLAYLYMFIKILTTLDLTSHIMHIEIRLRMMADLVQHHYSMSENAPGFIGDSICNKNWLYSDACTRTTELKSRVRPLKILTNNDCNEIQWLTRCYLLLTEQVEFINHIFGFRILLNSLSLLIDIVRFTNLAVRIIVGSQRTRFYTGYFPAVSSMMRQLTCIAVLVSLVDHCEKTYNQKDRIVSTIDHLIINKNPNEKLRSTMIELRGLVLARPINFNMAKFFRLDYSLLLSITSVVVTYTIILLQSMN